MKWSLGSGRNGSSFASPRLRFALPAMIIEIEPGFVVGAHLDVGGRSVRRISTREFDAHTLNPNPAETNISNVDQFRRAVQGVSDVLGNGGGRLGLLIPDASVRVAILSFEAFDETSKEADELIRWRVKDFLGFPHEEARISCQVIWRDQGNVGVLCVMARQTVLDEFHQALGLGNRGADLILPSTLALVPLLSAKDGESQMLVHVCSGWVTTVVTAGDRLLSWRNKDLSGEGADDLPHAVASEISRVLASSQDHLQLAVSKVLLCPGPPASREWGGELSRMVGREIEYLAPDPGPGSRLSSTELAVLEEVGTPISGLVRNLR